MTSTMNTFETEFESMMTDVRDMLLSDDMVPMNPVFKTTQSLSVYAEPFTPEAETTEAVLTPVPSISTNSSVVEPLLRTESEDDVDKPPIEAVLSDAPETTVVTESEFVSFLFLITLIAVVLRVASISPEFRHIREAITSLTVSAVQEFNSLRTAIRPLLNQRMETLSHYVFQTICVCPK